MTSNRVSQLVAARTGESMSVIRHLGFQLKPEPCEEPAIGEFALSAPESAQGE